MQSFRPIVFLGLIAFFNQPLVQGAESYQQVKGTNVELIPPAGFTAATTFTGFAQESTKASIVVAKLSAPYDLICRGFTKERMLTRGMKLLSVETIRLAGRPATLQYVEQKVRGITFHKWILIYGSRRQTTLITANFPVEKKRALSRKLKRALLTARVKK